MTPLENVTEELNTMAAIHNSGMNKASTIVQQFIEAHRHSLQEYTPDMLSLALSMAIQEGRLALIGQRL